LQTEKQSEESDSWISVDVCATMLAALDTRSYQQSLVRDANRVVERILEPLAFPWTHKVIPVARNLPCDIDELIDLITLDDGLYSPFENGGFGFGRFDTGQFRSCESSVILPNSSSAFRSATRRSNDPGVIEFTTISLPPHQFERFWLDEPVEVECPNTRFNGVGTELRCFETIQAIKKRKVEQARSSIRTTKISVRINSSSSRSLILNETQTTRKGGAFPPHLLEATLPQEVQIGRKLSGSHAKSVADSLGSYDVRHSLGLTNQSGKNSSRIAVGRTRIMWTEKSPSDQPQRVFFSSLLTGDRLEGGIQKRPRDIRLCIIIDGKAFSGRQKQRNTLQNEAQGLVKGINPLQGTLDCDQYIQNLLASDCEAKISAENYPPTLDCVPDSCGCIHVVCTSPGRISKNSVTPLLRNAAGKVNPSCTVCWGSTSMGLEVKECSDCGIFVHVQCCLDPGNISTTLVDGIRIAEWKCSLCCLLGNDQNQTTNPDNLFDGSIGVKKSRRKSRLPDKLKDSLVETTQSQRRQNTPVEKLEKPTSYKECAICRLSGGAMSRVSKNGTDVWVHEVCRLWTAGLKLTANSDGQINMGKGHCSACGQGGDESLDLPIGVSNHSRKLPGLVKCAVVGCHVAVHPMCAMVSSLATTSMIESNDEGWAKTLDGIDSLKMRDVQLSKSFTLTCVTVEGTTPALGKYPGVNRKQTLPIIFCGIHNPKRERSFYGLPPGGKYLDHSTLRIPRI
jgi:hypothetical protein